MSMYMVKGEGSRCLSPFSLVSKKDDNDDDDRVFSIRISLKYRAAYSVISLDRISLISLRPYSFDKFFRSCKYNGYFILKFVYFQKFVLMSEQCC